MPLTFLCAAALAIDGDTLRCANIDAANGRVRLARIDAAELHAPGGEEAKRALAAMIIGPVTCRQVDALPDQTWQGHDRFGRIVARCSAQEQDLGEMMIAQGQARRWPR